MSLAGKLSSGSPRAHWSLKLERGVGGHLLVTVFKCQVCAAAVGEMPIFSGVFPGVQNFTQISMYCISAFFLTFVGFTGEEGGISDLLKRWEHHFWRQLASPV